MALATLADIKAYLDITVTDEDARLTALLSPVEAQVVKYLGYGPEASAQFDRANGSGGRCYVPAQYPVSSVDSLTIDGVTIPAENGDIPGYYVSDGAVWLSGSYRFTRGVGNVKLSYQAGYAVVPAAIKQAVVETVALRFKEIERIGVSSKSVANESISYSQHPLSESAKGFLDPFRKVF